MNFVRPKQKKSLLSKFNKNNSEIKVLDDKVIYCKEMFFSFNYMGVPLTLRAYKINWFLPEKKISFDGLFRYKEPCRDQFKYSNLLARKFDGQQITKKNIKSVDFIA